MKRIKRSKLGISDDRFLACCHCRLLEQLLSLLLKCLMLIYFSANAESIQCCFYTDIYNAQGKHRCVRSTKSWWLIIVLSSSFFLGCCGFYFCSPFIHTSEKTGNRRPMTKQVTSLTAQCRLLQPGKPSYHSVASSCWQFGWATNWGWREAGIHRHEAWHQFMQDKEVISQADSQLISL